MKRFFVSVVCMALCLLTFGLTACTPDPYKDYQATGLEAKSFVSDYEKYNLFGCDKAQIFSDYGEYAACQFQLEYTKGYFENNDLLVFVISTNSSEDAAFEEVLEDEGKLYPCFLINEPGETITDDFILISYCVELPKSENYQVGTIFYKKR